MDSWGNVRFELGDQVGHREKAVVHQAQDKRDGTNVALRLLSGLSEAGQLTLMDTLSKLEQLGHAGIARITAHGRFSASEFYVASEWLSGQTLQQRLVSGPLRSNEAFELVRRLASALDAAARL